MALKTLIVDDEAPARSRLRKLIASIPDVAVAGEARDGIEAVSLIRDRQPDLVLLDVQMPGLDGFEVLRSLPAKASLPLVVFTTAFDQYAMAAFEANAIGYLLKPVNRDRLRVVIERVRQVVGSPERATDERARLRRLAGETSRPLRQVVARLRDRYVLIGVDEVCFFRVEEGLTKVKTVAGSFLAEYSLADVEARLPDPPFFRAHRSAIVNLRKIKEIVPMFKGGYVLIMKDNEGSEIQVSERQSRRVRELLQK